MEKYQLVHPDSVYIIEKISNLEVYVGIYMCVTILANVLPRIDAITIIHIYILGKYYSIYSHYLLCIYISMCRLYYTQIILSIIIQFY